MRLTFKSMMFIISTSRNTITSPGGDLEQSSTSYQDDIYKIKREGKNYQTRFDELFYFTWTQPIINQVYSSYENSNLPIYQPTQFEVKQKYKETKPTLELLSDFQTVSNCSLWNFSEALGLVQTLILTITINNVKFAV